MPEVRANQGADGSDTSPSMSSIMENNGVVPDDDSAEGGRQITPVVYWGSGANPVTSSAQSFQSLSVTDGPAG